MMKVFKILRVIVGLTLFVSSTSAAAAEQDPEYYGLYQRLNEINTDKDWLRSDKQRSKDVLGGRILDKRSKVIGKVEDVILSQGGAITYLQADLSRLNQRSFLADFSALGMDGVSSGYKSSYTDDEIKTMLPNLLAGIHPAAGSAEDASSLKKIIGAQVISEDGRKLGKVEDVFFGDYGRRADYLYIAYTGRGLHKGSIAIPFNQIKFVPGGMKPELSVTPVMAEAIAQYAQGGTRKFQPLK